MSRPKHTRHDANQARILSEARALGILVWDLSDLGGEVLDCMMFWRSKAIAVEIKAPDKAASLTPGEKAALLRLRHVGARAIVATCIDDVIRAFEFKGE